VKIDRTFVSGVAGDAYKRAMVKTILSLGIDLDLHVVTTGIEDPEQSATLRELGCDIAQGFWIARPMSGQDLIRYLEVRNASVEYLKL